MAKKNYYFAWNGKKNTTSGQANETTGNYNLYGEIEIFASRKERDDFVDCYYNEHSPSDKAVAVNKKTARRYYLGMTMADYNRMFECMQETLESKIREKTNE